MPSSSPCPPPPSTITPSQFSSILSLYPSTISKTYKTTPRLKDAKKLSHASEDDKWRYDELPRMLARRKGKDGEGVGVGRWLEKEELERLVEWKITHGHYRPTLPSLIRQNASSLIESTTSTAFSSLTSYDSTHLPPPYPQIALSLSTLTKPLKGVGPATGALLLSIHRPDAIPFFSDELYAWLVVPNHNGMNAGKEGKLKLKYDVKEYERLYGAWVDFRWRFGLREKAKEVRAVDVEKVAFVVGHWDLLSEQERESVVAMGEGGGLEAQKKGKEETEDGEEGMEDFQEMMGREDAEEDGGTNGTEDVGSANRREKLTQGEVAEKERTKRTARLLPKGRPAAEQQRQLVEEETSVRRSKRLKK